ncbi:helix-turn-helix domain-containing protein [Streptomyces xiamenensis]|uniref:helix-turn-helix domain-containing protein n=1 Tax=Streptomyces xiamenensis TaxID=408015 RepID=UPI0036F0B578
MSSGDQHDLGRALRELRSASGLTGATVARRASMSAGKLSKIENGRILPSVVDVELVLTALEVSAEAKAEFLRAARAAVTESTAWRTLRRAGPWKHQQAIRAIESQTQHLRLFQGQAIPGLLQTPDYISAIFSRRPELLPETKAKTVAARLERQSALYQAERSFDFLICEHVLRWLMCDPRAMAVQLDRLISLSRLPNVSIGVIPLNRRMPDFPMTCFVIHDDRLVVIETFHAEVATRDTKDIATYLDIFGRFADVALYGAEMCELVEHIRDEFLTQRESG